MIHVLEHIEGPFVFLNIMILNALNEQGSIFIEVPNIDSAASKIADNVWAHFTPHFHTNHFTLQTFIEFCLKNGLNISL